MGRISFGGVPPLAPALSAADMHLRAPAQWFPEVDVWVITSVRLESDVAMQHNYDLKKANL